MVKLFHKTSWSDREIERLLSNGHLSGAQYDAIEARVLKHTARAERKPAPGPFLRATPRRGAFWGWVGGFPLAAGLTGALVWFLAKPVLDSDVALRQPPKARPAAAAHGFVTKGAVDAATSPLSGALDAGCHNDDPHVCHYGDTLYFSINSAIVGGYVGAYAEPLGSPSAERIWYLPLGEAAPNVPRGEGTVVVPHGVRMTSLHTPGRYRVTLWVSHEPIRSRDVAALRLESVPARDSVIVEVKP